MLVHILSGRKIESTSKTPFFHSRKCGVHSEGSTTVLTDISHAKDIEKITADIRKLFGVELVRFNRSISLPSHNPETHYLLFRQPTGPRYEATTRQQLFLTLGLVRRPAEQVTTWDRMLPSKSQFPKDVIGIHRW
uniref:(California timema) hypothetical protein n=1 Tax=Timema californicum TaxID=61474 RepID=A0A7R9PC11_TIMCA|nr:unnamed protein product [Timema californicum]